MFPFEARYADELSLVQGELVEVLQTPDGGWSEGWDGLASRLFKWYHRM
jgi:hypothetical protein